MPAEFAPLLKRSMETFVSSGESASIVYNIFITAGIMVAGMLITWAFVWSYEKDMNLLVAMVAFMAVAYGVAMVIITVVNMGSLGAISFKMSIGASILACIMFIIVGLVFLVKFFRNRSVSLARGSYVPSPVSSYIDH